MAKRTTKKSHTFHPTQQMYMFARAAYETAHQAYLDECNALGLYDRDDDESYEIQDALSEKHAVLRLLRVLRDSERAMVDWSVDHACRFAPSKAQEVRDLRAAADRRPDVWSQMVDIAARLAA